MSEAAGRLGGWAAGRLGATEDACTVWAPEQHTVPHDDRPSALGRVEALLVEQGVVGEEGWLGDEAKRVCGSGGGDKPPVE